MTTPSSIWPNLAFAELIGVDHPIVQAPMTGDATVELAAAVSNAGGLGSIGCSASSPEQVRELVSQLRASTNRPFNLNFLAHPAPRVNDEINRRTHRLVQEFYQELGTNCDPDSVILPYSVFGEEYLSTLEALSPPVVSFHFGVPGTDAINRLRQAGTKVMSSATTVAEAVQLEAQGVDVIIAQGWEAGGHRGSFEPNFETVGIGGIALVPQVADAVSVPVVCAGGVADGRGIAAAFMLGACGVQMGTAFLSCPEANVDDDYREAIRNARDEDTHLSRAFSGRPARARRNRYTEAMIAERLPLPDFPTMFRYSDPLISSNKDDFRYWLYGQSAALNRELPAAELMKLLVEESAALLSRGTDRPAAPPN